MTGSHRCLGVDGVWLSGADIADRVRTIASEFGPGRRLVALEATPTLEFALLYLAALDAGHTVLLGSPTTLSGLVATYDPDNVGTERRHGSPTHDLHADLALLLSTSGSTGSAKLVRLSRTNLIANARSIAQYLDLGPDDRGISSLPLHYCYGLSVLHSHLAAGAGFYLSSNSVVDACFWREMRDQGITNLAGVPHTFDLIERVGAERLDLPGLRFVTQAGGRMEPARVERFATLGSEQGWDFVVMYGQTEATARMAYLPPQLAHRHPDAVGIAIPGGAFEIRPLADDARPATGATGRVVYRGRNVMMGYAELPDDLCRGAELDELWTGDLGFIDAEGLLHVVGRESRFAKLFGTRIDLERVERQLASVGWTASAASNDQLLVVAVETGCPGDQNMVRAVEDEVVDLTGLPSRIIAVIEVEQLPRLPNGKLDHQSLLATATSRPVVDTGDADEVSGIFELVLGVPEVRPSDTFASLGGDSLSYVEVSVRLEERLGHLPGSWNLMTVAALQDCARIPANRRWARVDTTIVLRAVAIMLIVSSHMRWRYLPVGGHLLLAVAGYNFARFHLTDPDRPRWWTTVAQTFGKIAVVTSAWVAFQMIVWGDHGVATLLLVNGYLGDPEHTEARWRYWYVEATVQIGIALLIVFAWRAVRRIEARHRFAFPLVLLVPALALRFEYVMIGGDDRNAIFQADTVAWIFLLGWAVQRAVTVRQKIAVAALAVATVPGYFTDDDRNLRLLIGVLVLASVPWVPVLRPLHRLVGLIASASLSIYLTHYAVITRLDDHLSPPLVFSVALVVGVGAWFAASRLGVWSRRTIRNRRDQRGIRETAVILSPSHVT